jgi:SSS family solute:Na+ symporter
LSLNSSPAAKIPSYHLGDHNELTIPPVHRPVRAGLFVVLSLVMLISALMRPAVSAKVAAITWDELPSLPPSAGQARQPGVAGPFAGVHGNVLMVAGGANFPDKMPWDGGAKIWWDDIWVLEKLADGTTRWVTDKTLKLPRRLGYGVSVSTPEGIVCAGGNDADRCYADVFLLSWDANAREVKRTTLPSMPEPLSFMAGAFVGNTIYVAGGQHVMKNAIPSSAFWALDLSKRDRPGEFKWSILPTWPGAARVVPIAAGQRAAKGEEFFLFSGRVQEPGKRTQILSDAYAFNPASRSWRTLAKIGGDAGASVMAGMAAPGGSDEVLVFGGDRGDLFLELEAHDFAIEASRAKLGSATPGERTILERHIEDRLAAKRKIYGNHPGFGREVFAYDTLRDAWRVVTRSTVEPQVTTFAVRWGDAIVIPSGEIRPGVRTPKIVRAVPVSN